MSNLHNEIKELVLFKRNLGAFLRVYTFLSQIYDYGNTAIEKRAMLYEVLREQGATVLTDKQPVT